MPQSSETMGEYEEIKTWPFSALVLRNEALLQSFHLRKWQLHDSVKHCRKGDKSWCWMLMPQPNFFRKILVFDSRRASTSSSEALYFYSQSRVAPMEFLDPYHVHHGVRVAMLLSELDVARIEGNSLKLPWTVALFHNVTMSLKSTAFRDTKEVGTFSL